MRVTATEQSGRWLMWCTECGPLVVVDDFAAARHVAEDHLEEHGCVSYTMRGPL